MCDVVVCNSIIEGLKKFKFVMLLWCSQGPTDLLVL